MTTAQVALASAPVVPLRFLVAFNPRPSRTLADESCYLPMDAISEFGPVDSSRLRPTSELLQGYSFIQDGDVAYAKVTPCFENGKGMYAQNLPGGYAFATTEITVLRPRPGLEPRYLAWVLQSDGFRSPGESLMSGAGGLKRVPEGYAASFRIPYPSIPAQRAVADFLDRETSQIDAFIAKNEELIALLTERRSAVTAELGLEHVGTGPRLKHHLREIDVRAGSSWSDLPLLSVSIAWGVRRRDEVTQDAPQASDLSGYKVAERGDVVLNRMRAFQGALGVSPVRGLVSPDYAVLRSRGDADADWLAHVMKTPRFVGEMTSRLKGIGGTESGAVRTPRINVADLSDIRVWVPSAALQAAGVDHMVAALESIDSAIATAGRAIDLARERRAALISAAVTGKIDVGVSA